MKKLYTVLCVIASTSCLGAYSYSQASHSSQNTSEKDRISITIATKQATFKVGEPIVLSIVVKNISEYKYCEKSIAETGHAEWNDYNIEVKDAEGNVVPHLSKPLLPLRQRPELSGSRGIACIAPGENMKESISVEQIVNMSEPGTYSVQIAHRDQGTYTNVLSNIIQLTVTQ